MLKSCISILYWNYKLHEWLLAKDLRPIGFVLMLLGSIPMTFVALVIIMHGREGFMAQADIAERLGDEATDERHKKIHYEEAERLRAGPQPIGDGTRDPSDWWKRQG